MDTDANENHPINCANWYELYAFCIWDGGFLPSDAEWNYAASGGSEQRVYPWSSPASSTVIDCSFANYKGAADGTDFCVSPGATNNVGSESPKGDGKYGQADLAGNALEWNLDTYYYYTVPCNDCVALSAFTRVVRGGGERHPASYLFSAGRLYNDLDPSSRVGFGARCARTP